MTKVFGEDVIFQGKVIIASGEGACLILPVLTTEQRDKMTARLGAVKGMTIVNADTGETEVIEEDGGNWHKSANVATMENQIARHNQRAVDVDARFDYNEEEVSQKFMSVEGGQEEIKAGQEVTQGKIDGVQDTQATNKAEILVAEAESRDTILAAETASRNATISRLDHEASGLPALRDKMDETLLPLSGEEIPEQDNPITLMDLPQYIYWNESDHPFQFGGGTLKRESGSWLNGEEIIVLIQTKSPTGEWGTIWDEKYAEEVDFERKQLPQVYNDGAGLRISVKQKSEGDGYHIWRYSFISAEREE